LPPNLIHFFGPDGGGKSTQADLLAVRLMSKEIKVRKYWTRSPHTLAYILWRLSIKIGFFRTVSNVSGAYIKIPSVQKNRVLSELWAILELVSVIPLIIRAHLYLLCGYTLIAERYILDTIAFVAFSINDSSFSQSYLAKLFRALIPTKTKFIFIDADYETISKRRAHYLASAKVWNASIKTELEPREFIDFQRATYKALARTTNALIICTAKHSKQETFNLIVKYLSI
jgi:thymidylate kinase